MKQLLDNTNYTFLDLSKYIQATIPNGTKKTTTVSQSYYLLSMLEHLTNIEGSCSGIVNCVERIVDYHRAYLNDIGSMTTACILNINCEIKHISHLGIKEKAFIFQKLPTYTKNPLEPLLKLLVKESPYKAIIGKIVGEICRGSHVDAKLSIYELEEFVKKQYGGKE